MPNYGLSFAWARFHAPLILGCGSRPASWRSEAIADSLRNIFQSLFELVFIKKKSVRQAAYFTVVANGLAVSEGGVMPHPLLNHALSS